MTDLPMPHFFWRTWREQPSSLNYLAKRSQALKIPAGSGEVMIEQIVRRHVYYDYDWTGQNEDCFKNPDSPVNIIQDRDKFVAKYGRNPTISCGSSSIAYIGWLAYFGILAREVNTSHRVTGATDVAAEWWCGSLMRWILTVPHYNAHFSVGGDPLSALEFATLDRKGVQVPMVAIDGEAKPRVMPDTIPGWRGMSKDMRVMCGNGPYAGMTGPDGNTPIPDEAWTMLPVLPLEPGTQLPHTLQYGTFDPDAITNPPS